MKKYDFLVVGSGLFGSTFAHFAHRNKKKCLVIEKRNHIAGNIYTEKIEGIDVHKYGSHYFHTNSKNIWKFINKFGEFYNVPAKVKVNYQNKIYSFPVNLMTLNQLWGVLTPEQAIDELNKRKIKFKTPNENLEKWALSEIGEEIFEIFYKGYTEKQWGKPCQELPSSIIKRIPIRLTYDDNYHSNNKYQGIPSDGYTSIIENMLKGIEVKTNFDFFELPDWTKIAKNLVYTGPLDKFFNYQFGRLEYRSLVHQEELRDGDYQGCFQINYTDKEIPYTRIIEHKHFNPFKSYSKTVITKEYPAKYDGTNEPFYPIRTDINSTIHLNYQKLYYENKNRFGGGRLFEYQYMDMDQTIASAFNLLKKLNLYNWQNKSS